MEAATSVTPEIARKIAGVIGEVMHDLRALVDASINFEGLESDTLAILAEGVCKRAHSRLDRCAIRLGAVPAGNFEGEDFKDEGDANG